MASHPQRLAPVKRLRETERDQLLRQLADANQAANVLEEQQQQLQAEIAALKQDRQQAAAATDLDPNLLMDNQRYAMVLQAQQADLTKKQQLVQQEIMRRQMAVTQADQRVKVIDKLQQRRTLALLQQAEKATSQQQDEAAQQADLRKRNESTEAAR